MDVCDVILTVNVIGERAVPHYHNHPDSERDW